MYEDATVKPIILYANLELKSLKRQASSIDGSGKTRNPHVKLWNRTQISCSTPKSILNRSEAVK